MITIDQDKFEHILNCMCNQKYIHEQNTETQKEWQAIIDKAWNEGMDLLIKPITENQAFGNDCPSGACDA